MASIINSTDTGSGGLITTGDSSDELQLQTAETTAVTITSGQQSAFIAGTASAPAVTTTGDLNTGIYFPAADNIGFATGGTIRGRWTTDGLCFGSDTAAANALDDYEEGTWTPVVSSLSGFSGSITITSATYTKIGNTVFIRADYGFNSSSGNVTAGDLAVLTGLPFTPATQAAAGTVFLYNSANGGLVNTVFTTIGSIINLVIVWSGAASNTRADGGFSTYGHYKV